MNEPIPELEALRLLLEQCRHLIVSRGQDAFKRVNAKEARRQADRLDLLEKAEESLDVFANTLEAFPELFAQEAGTANAEPPTTFQEVQKKLVISQESLGQRVTISSTVANATGYRDGRRFTIEAGSQMRADETSSIHEWLRELRASLRANGVVVRQGARYVFVKNAVFRSPTAAAGVVLGRTANGLEAWKFPNGSPLGKKRLRS